MYIAINDIKGGKRIDLSYSIQNFDSRKETQLSECLATVLNTRY